MNAIKQYIELFEANRAAIDAHSPEALNRKRQHALSVLKQLERLPDKGDEGFPTVSLNEMFAPDYGVNISRIGFGNTAGGGCDSPISSGQAAATVVNDVFMPCSLPKQPGLEVCSIADAASKYPELFEKEIAPPANPIVALNNLLAQDGVFIRVGRSADIKRAVQVLSNYNTLQPMMGIRRVRIHVEDGASVSVLLCDHPAADAAPHLTCRVVEASVGTGACLRLYDLEEANSDSRRASVIAAEQAEGSTFKTSSLFLNGGQTRNEYYPIHLGEHCATHLGGLVIGDKGQAIDNSVLINHNHPRCTSEQLFKYALFDDAKGSFEGMVMVEKGAVHTEAHQSNRNLLASARAKMFAMPQLEIYCDEVKASHGSATGQLDERALFYMRQRGIPEAEARMMLVNAFMTDVLDTVEEEHLRERLRHLVDLRLRGAETVCASCEK